MVQASHKIKEELYDYPFVISTFFKSVIIIFHLFVPVKLWPPRTDSLLMHQQLSMYNDWLFICFNASETGKK
jgi:hypothetical protein